MSIPSVRRGTYLAQKQKLMIDVTRDLENTSACGMLIRAMRDNPELAADLLEDIYVFDAEPVRLAIGMIVLSVYKSLQAQIESNELMKVA